jgi:hypothetical protein
MEREIGRLYQNNQFLSTKDRMTAILQSFPAASAHAIHRELDLQAEQALPPACGAWPSRSSPPSATANATCNPWMRG